VVVKESEIYLFNLMNEMCGKCEEELMAEKRDRESTEALILLRVLEPKLNANPNTNPNLD